MQRVYGVGGVFFRAKSERKALLAWYRDNLGIEFEEAWGGAVFDNADAPEGEGLTWSIFPSDTTYFGASDFMVNYKVHDLDAMLAQLRAAGAEVLDQRLDNEHGKFGWAVDPAGNRLELWQPPG